MNNSNPIITSTANEKIKRIRSLMLKKNRDAEKVFVVEGAGHITKALENGFQIEILLLTKEDAKLANLARAQNTEICNVNDKVASYVTNRDNPQAAIAVFKQRFCPINMVGQGLWLGLENVRDPGNLGSIIRTADAVGVGGIILIGNCCDTFSPEVIRATTGSFSAVALVEISLADFLKWRESYKNQIIGTHLHKNAVDYREVEASSSAILLMGGEQAGLSDDLSAICDVFAKIPMRDGVESLNLAVSTGIMLYMLSH